MDHFSTKPVLQFLVIGLTTLLGACSSVEEAPTDRPLNQYSTDTIYKSTSGVPQCKTMLTNYCNYLYSPEVLGNLEIKRRDTSTQILQGDTENGFSQAFYRYSLAKVRSQKMLPHDFYRILRSQGYFEKLESFLKRPPRTLMTMANRLERERQNFELGAIWGAALNETLLIRMLRKYPAFYRIPEKLVPLEIDLERARIRRTLATEISQAIWRDDENWRRVEFTFKGLKTSFGNVIDKLDMPPSFREDWKKRIEEVRLVLPGSLPEISDEECSTTKSNAFYYTYLNVITVCAGDFNSEDILQTLAHEMAHSLGADRTRYLFEISSAFGKEFANFRKSVCETKTFSCDEWTKFSTNLPTLLDTLSAYRTELPEFQQCLKRRKTTQLIFDSDIERISKKIVNERVSELATSDRFLRITKPELPLVNGKVQKNPNYLNPCNYYLWSQGEEPFDDELTTLMFFTAAYRCSSGAPAEKMRSSIEQARTMTDTLLRRTLRMEGEYSGRAELESPGFSSPPEERFADVVGSYAMSDFLKRYPTPWERRNKLLASASWLCSEPSLASRFPEESAIEKQYVFDSHSEGDQRRMELFSQPLREAIGCEKDFEFNECRLPFVN